MKSPALPTYEVKLPISGMICRILVRATTPARALSLTEKYLLDAGMKEPGLSIASADVQTVAVVEDIEAQVAAQNHEAVSAVLPPVQSKVFVNYCEAESAWEVRSGDELLEWFPSQVEAQAYANKLIQIQGK